MLERNCLPDVHERRTASGQGAEVEVDEVHLRRSGAGAGVNDSLLRRYSTLSEAKAHLSRYARVCHDEPVVVTVNGVPAFQLAPLEEEDDLITASRTALKLRAASVADSVFIHGKCLIASDSATPDGPERRR